MSERDSVFSKIYNRRQVLRGMIWSGLGAAALTVMPPNASRAMATPAGAPPENGGPAPEAGEILGAVWPGITLVEGEPLLEGGVQIPDLLLATAETRFRIEANTNNTPTNRPAGTILAITPGEENFASAGNQWTGGDLIYTKGQLQDGSIHEVTANDIGKTRVVTQVDFEANPALVPDVVQEHYQTPAELPPSSTVAFDTEAFGGIYDGFGGTTDLLSAAVTAWGETIPTITEKGVKIPHPESVFAANPLDSWRKSVAFSAYEASLNDEATSGSFDICKVTGEVTPCMFYRRVNPETGDIDVISLFENETSNRLFAVTRFSNNADGLSVIGNGFVEQEGLVAAYGEEAQVISAFTTALNGSGVIQLTQEIESLPQSGVFISGDTSGSQFAPKIEVAPTQRVTYTRIDVADQPAQYRALILEQQEVEEPTIQTSGQLTQTMVTADAAESPQTTEVVAKEFMFVARQEANEWVELPSPDLLSTRLQDFSQEFAINPDQLNVTYHQHAIGGGDTILIAMANNTVEQNGQYAELSSNAPLLVARQNVEREWEWQPFSPDMATDILKSMGREFSVGYHVPTQNPDFLKGVGDNFDEAMFDGPLHWIYTATLDTDFTNKSNPAELSFNFSELDNLVRKVTAQGVNNSQYHHILWGLARGFVEVPENLASLSSNLRQNGFSQAETSAVFRKLLTQGVQTVIPHILEISAGHENRVFSLNNEPRPAENLVIDGRPQIWTDQLGEEAIDLAFQTAAPLVGDEDVLMINNTDNLIVSPRSNSDLTRLRRINADLTAKGMPRRLGYGIQAGLWGNEDWSSAKKNIARFVDAEIEVYVTEARAVRRAGFTDDQWKNERAQRMGEALEALFDAGARGFTMFYHDSGDDETYDVDATPANRTALNEAGKPNRTTFNLNRILYSRIQNLEKEIATATT